MTTAIGRGYWRNSWRPEGPLSTALDLLGLGLCLAVAAALHPLSHGPGSSLFSLLLAAFGVNARILLGQLRSIDTVLRRVHASLLAVPTLAALSAILVLAIGRSYYSVRFALLFITLWTVWILVAQLLLRRTQLPLRVLVIAPAPFESALAGIHGLRVASVASPPLRFGDWDFVVVDPARRYSASWSAWLAQADMSGTRLLSAPLVLEGLTQRMPMNMLQGEWAHELFRSRFSYLLSKRVLDTILVLLVAPVLLPLIAVLALAIYLDDGGPVLYRQKRIGQYGHPFTMLKFRTMRAQTEPSEPGFTGSGDDRVTRLGRWLRRFRLDELPQVWNVVRGQMSLVGPRPEQVELGRRFRSQIPLYDLRHNVRPGITGWAQVRQGYADSVDATREKLCFDLYYVRRCSWRLDLWILFKTVQILVTGFGAR